MNCSNPPIGMMGGADSDDDGAYETVFQIFAKDTTHGLELHFFQIDDELMIAPTVAIIPGANLRRLLNDASLRMTGHARTEVSGEEWNIETTGTSIRAWKLGKTPPPFSPGFCYLDQ